MAKKIDPPKQSHDHVHALELAGRAVTVHEYGFFDSFEVYTLAARLIADLTDALALVDGASWELVQGVLARHRDTVLQLLQRACSLDADWLAKLGDADGATLLMTWWSVNGPFFMRRAVTTLAIRARTAQASATPKSSPPLSATDTPPTSSAATPSGS